MTRSAICHRFLEKLARTPDKAKRLAILKACAKVRAAWVEELLWEALGDPCEHVRDFAVSNLAGRRTLDLARALGRLERPPWYARSAVIRLLGIHRARDGMPAIRRAVEDTANVKYLKTKKEKMGHLLDQV